ncbi:hypothetical protein [Pseudaestuariivita atlantica]|uniref:Uncharacterized protein n=1 Tax=Pseudaestuariivita atlantica TaxID=1317121 RepID=A0A0L1JRZ7_9RHOB|nr:hypothetical protein [Pseudaestuariivita atlantica]KNG94569.1 hypothetical protein ATO11_03945 [Pseudaestuariivita atlantica]
MKTDQNSLSTRFAIDLAVLSFVFHFAWEILQAPLYSSLDDASHSVGTLECLQATLGDVIIMFAALALVRWIAGPAWNDSATGRGPLVFLVVGLGVTIVLEFVNTSLLGRWAYGPDMPSLPVLGTGLAPLAQWVVIPLIVLWYLRRLHPAPAGGR